MDHGSTWHREISHSNELTQSTDCIYKAVPSLGRLLRVERLGLAGQFGKMIIRTHQTDTTVSTAIYSPCELYRYALTRVWDKDGKRVLFIMLNPSKATEQMNDPTVERCERRARALDFGSFRIVNIFALRETDPHLMRKAVDPAGPENYATLVESTAWADTIICAWGTHGVHRDQGAAVEAVLRETGKPLSSLGLTKHGHPKHPLYISYAQQPIDWPVGA